MQYDKRVIVQFQENAWCNEKMMEYWAMNYWKPHVTEESILVLDLHKAQKTERIQDILTNQCKAVPVFVPAGCTSLIQPLDVVYNAPFKKKAEAAAMKHMQDNLEAYVNGKFTASERRVLITKWVGQAWEELSQNKEMTVRAFRKCGISVAADGSEDFDIHIEGLDNYCVQADDIDTEDDDEDPFADVSESDSGTSTESDDD